MPTWLFGERGELTSPPLVVYVSVCICAINGFAFVCLWVGEGRKERARSNLSRDLALVCPSSTDLHTQTLSTNVLFREISRWFFFGEQQTSFFRIFFVGLKSWCLISSNKISGNTCSAVQHTVTWVFYRQCSRISNPPPGFSRHLFPFFLNCSHFLWRLPNIRPITPPPWWLRIQRFPDPPLPAAPSATPRSPASAAPAPAIWRTQSRALLEAEGGSGGRSEGKPPSPTSNPSFFSRLVPLR